jgi:hypothetical protein
MAERCIESRTWKAIKRRSSAGAYIPVESQMVFCERGKRLPSFTRQNDQIDQDAYTQESHPEVRGGVRVPIVGNVPIDPGFLLGHALLHHLGHVASFGREDVLSRVVKGSKWR